MLKLQSNGCLTNSLPCYRAWDSASSSVFSLHCPSMQLAWRSERCQFVYLLSAFHPAQQRRSVFVRRAQKFIPIYATKQRLQSYTTVPFASSVPEESKQRIPEDDRGSILPVKVISIGTSCYGAVSSLMLQPGFELETWCLDWDEKALEKAPSARRVAVKLPEGELQSIQDVLSQDEVLQLTAAKRLADGSTTCGLAFVLASAGDSRPSSSQLVLHLCTALRQAGHFTVAAVTSPFEFEGPKKTAAAEQLVTSLQQIAHTTTVIEQDVLSKNCNGMNMTAAEAMAIADRALEHAVRCIVNSAQSPEVLKIIGTNAAWHTKGPRRKMLPAIQSLLMSSGTSALGRGQAVVTLSAAQRMGTTDTLMCLAADAVRAAAESPFLEDSLSGAPAMLCTVTLPSSFGRFTEAAEKYKRKGDAVSPSREAVQAAAGPLVTLLRGKQTEVVVAAHYSNEPVTTSGNREIRVDATLLVVRDPARASSASSTSSTSSAGGSSRVAPRQPPPGIRLPPSAWGAMSALAGGSAMPFTRMPSTSNPTAVEQRKLGLRNAVTTSKPTSTPTPSNNHPHNSNNVDAPQTSNRSVGDLLVDSLTAQSLDLPPQAAKWRQRIRRQLESTSLVVLDEVADSDSDGSESEAGLAEGGAKGMLGGWFGWSKKKKIEPTIRDRVSGMLQKDRSEMWDNE